MDNHLTTTSGGSSTVNLPLPVSVPVTTRNVTTGELGRRQQLGRSTSGLTLTLP